MAEAIVQLAKGRLYVVLVVSGPGPVGYHFPLPSSFFIMCILQLVYHFHHHGMQTISVNGKKLMFISGVGDSKEFLAGACPNQYFVLKEEMD